jgi:hypothetical protein
MPPHLVVLQCQHRFHQRQHGAVSLQLSEAAAKEQLQCLALCGNLLYTASTTYALTICYTE